MDATPIEQDKVIRRLLEVIAGVRSGSIVGVAVVTTLADGKVSIERLSSPFSDEMKMSA